MGGKKKLNPNRVPRTTEEKITYERRRAIKLTYIIFLSVLCDKIGLTDDDLARTYKGCLWFVSLGFSLPNLGFS